MNVKRKKEKTKQVTTLKTLLIIGFGLALLVTTIVRFVNDNNKKKDDNKIEEKNKEESK